jgi:thiol-disulfide isomerase/thioredoxin
MTPGRREALILGGAGLAAAAAGFLAGPALLKGFGGGEADSLWAANLKDLSGKPRTVGEWRGRVLVCNFWATWCAPCREEIPGFVRLQDSHGARGLTFVGIAIDQPEKVAQFAQEFRMNYPVLVGGLGALDLLREAGNRAGVLPYTVVIDRHGGLISQRAGGVNLKDLETMIQPLL